MLLVTRAPGAARLQLSPHRGDNLAAMRRAALLEDVLTLRVSPGALRASCPFRNPMALGVERQLVRRSANAAASSSRHGMLRRMQALKAVVKNGRLVLDAPTDLPEGEVVELAIVQDDDDSELAAELEASAEDEKAGRLVDLKDVIARLGTR